MVKCVDGYERLCHIRGKFTGRSKRENALSQGTWVLIGLRQWDADKEFALKTSKIPGKSIQKCDLLEIYTPAEREKLRVQEKIFQEIADENGGGGGGGGGGDSDDEFRMSKQTVEFKDQATLEYQEIIEQGGKLSRMKKTSYHDIYDGITSDSDDDSDDDDHENETSDDDAPSTAAATDSHDISSRHTAIKLSVPDLPAKQQQAQQHSSKMVFDEVDIDEI